MNASQEPPALPCQKEKGGETEEKTSGEKHNDGLYIVPKRRRRLTHSTTMYVQSRKGQQ